ncbi:MAG TPA: DUF1800 domain-containing protein [Bryobacteraceae bacterium]|nr:DUF1800 domain-containing protein [Bryobacteraceae bacterium]
MKKFRAGLAILCAATFVGSTVASTSANKPDYHLFNQRLAHDQQIIHVLDRLTFGPRPGDAAQVKKLGIKKWIDLQLHPDRIPENPALAKRLEPLDSLRIDQAEAVAKYPTPQMIRAVALGLQQPPEDPVARAAVERLVRRYKFRKDLPESEAARPVRPLEELFTVEQIKTLRNGKPEERRAALESIPEEQMDDAIIAMPQGLRQQLMAVADPVMRRRLVVANAPQQAVAYDLNEAKLYRAVYSNRQLQEELVDFWYNHFNVFLDKGAERILVPTYERESIRPHVLGKFRDLLEATAISPAMLFYLDNWQSVAPEAPRPNQKGKQRPTRGLNENYARELMELHTLGVDGGYTQKDIIEVARCFTGWTIRQPNQGGGFYFNDRVHDKGEKVVLGVTIPAGGGQEDGEKVLDILAAHPSTARFISRKLAQRFVADDPPPALLDHMAKTFTETQGDIRAVLETMLDSKEFLSAGAFRAKMKTPFEMIVSAVRATGAEVDYATPLANQIAQLGEPLYRKLEPTGYPSANAEWTNSASLLGRMNFALQLAQNRVPGVKVDTAQFGDKLAAKPAGKHEPKVATPATVAQGLLFSPPSPQTLDAIQKALALQAGKKGGPTPAMVAGLVIGSPEFQRR